MRVSDYIHKSCHVMELRTVIPRALKPGDTVRIVAPAGPIEHREDLDRGVAALERMQFRVTFSDRIFHSVRYLAGTDEERAEELVQALEDPAVQAIIALRGGFGCSRLIPLIDPERIRGHCKVFMGFSDLTTLHLYFRRCFGWLTFHGPMAASQALGNIGAAQARHLMALLTDASYRPTLSFPEFRTWIPGQAEGELTGGCLSIVVASLGTPYEIDTSKKILFLEDLGEPPYRIDRMFTQLRLAGKLDHVSGLLLGKFLDCEAAGASYTLEESLIDILAGLEIPVVANFPAGHGPENWALPLGSRIRLDASARQIEFLGPAVADREESV